MEITELIDAAAKAAVEHNHSPFDDGELAAILKPGSEARSHVWDRHYGTPVERKRLDEKLAASPPEFQAAVATVEHALADELADDNARRARVRAENPNLFHGEF
jgi:hypothetical protein